jgi:hypothetical protein
MMLLRDMNLQDRGGGLQPLRVHGGRYQIDRATDAANRKRISGRDVAARRIRLSHFVGDRRAGVSVAEHAKCAVPRSRIGQCCCTAGLVIIINCVSIKIMWPKA